jgi:hypothetical protein
MSTPERIPAGVQRDRPSAARMYDYFLGGHHNFEVDRKAADQATAIWPDMPMVLRANRAFLRRAVRFLVAQGIDQFLDIGSGIPTVGNVHEVAQIANPAARVVYVDSDPVAVAHSRGLVGDNPNVAVVRADAREADQLVRHDDVSRLLDLRRPVGVLIVAVLHFVDSDAEAYGAVRVLRDAVVPGSYLAIQHATDEGLSPETVDRLRQIYARTPTPVKVRSREEIARFFGDFDLVEPGLVYLPLWRPEGPDDPFVDEPTRCAAYAGVGRKR